MLQPKLQYFGHKVVLITQLVGGLAKATALLPPVTSLPQQALSIITCKNKATLGLSTSQTNEQSGHVL